MLNAEPTIRARSLIYTSILQKVIVALSGILLVAFTIFHLLGNLLLLSENRTAFNLYANSLNKFPIIHQALELGLAIALIAHIASAIPVAHRNRQAKPQDYSAVPWWRRLTDRSMIVTGPLLLFFLLVHLKSFRLGPIYQYQIEIAGHQLPDWQSLVIETFQQPLYVGFYVVMMISFAIHLRHGITSAGQSLGLVRNTWIERSSLMIALAVAIGFATIPAWIYWHN
jgi:succinate dehydrogenase / fumarate reductase, cytochrome b subunit